MKELDSSGPVYREDSAGVRAKTEDLRQKEGSEANQGEQMLTIEKRIKKNRGVRGNYFQKQASHFRIQNLLVVLSSDLAVFNAYLWMH